jgi:hypothetical protein
MWPRRRRGLGTDPLSPRDQLWHDLRDFFEDDTGYFAGGTVWFLDIRPEDVRRLWDSISVKATSVQEEPRIYYDDDTDPDTPAPPDAIERLLARDGVTSVMPVLVGVRSQGELLPDLFLELDSDAFGIYWWVGHPKDDWNPATASALAELLGELRALVPNAHLELEHSDDPNELWQPIERYLHSTRGES